MARKNLRDNRPRLTCSLCSQPLLKTSESRHLREQHYNKKAYVCEFCGKSSGRPFNLRRHIPKCDQNPHSIKYKRPIDQPDHNSTQNENKTPADSVTNSAPVQQHDNKSDSSLKQPPRRRGRPRKVKATEKLQHSKQQQLQRPQETQQEANFSNSPAIVNMQQTVPLWYPPPRQALPGFHSLLSSQMEPNVGHSQPYMTDTRLVLYPVEPEQTRYRSSSFNETQYQTPSFGETQYLNNGIFRRSSQHEATGTSAMQGSFENTINTTQRAHKQGTQQQTRVMLPSIESMGQYYQQSVLLGQSHTLPQPHPSLAPAIDEATLAMPTPPNSSAVQSMSGVQPHYHHQSGPSNCRTHRRQTSSISEILNEPVLYDTSQGEREPSTPTDSDTNSPSKSPLAIERLINHDESHNY